MDLFMSHVQDSLIAESNFQVIFDLCFSVRRTNSLIARSYFQVLQEIAARHLKFSRKYPLRKQLFSKSARQKTWPKTDQIDKTTFNLTKKSLSQIFKDSVLTIILQNGYLSNSYLYEYPFLCGMKRNSWFTYLLLSLTLTYSRNF